MSKSLTIIQMNDSHGYLDLHQELFWSGAGALYRPAGGYGRIAALLDRARERRPGAVLALDCGDTIHGTYTAVKSRGEALIPILNAMGWDAMTAHWEFAYGPQHLREVVGRLNYPLLAINCYAEESGELVFDPYVIKEAGGLRIGIVGIAATIVDKVMPPPFSEGVYFTLGNEELPGYVDTLRNAEQVDLVVLVSHLGFPQEVKLAREVDGIDVLLSGHTHDRLYRPTRINDTIIIQSGCHGSFLGWLDLEVEDGKVVDARHELVVVDVSVDPDPEVQALVDEALAPHEDELSQVVGQTATPLNRNLVLESTMDNLLLQSMIEQTGAQLAFSNGWRYGAPVAPGPVTLNDLWNVIPVNPPISTCTITGAELWAMMEENLERTFSRDPYEQMGGYVKRCMGFRLYFKVQNPAGERIEEFFLDDGGWIEPERNYTATYVTTQGVPSKYGHDRERLDVHAVEALRRYLKRHEPAHADLRGTVIAI